MDMDKRAQQAVEDGRLALAKAKAARQRIAPRVKRARERMEADMKTPAGRRAIARFPHDDRRYGCTCCKKLEIMILADEMRS